MNTKDKINENIKIIKDQIDKFDNKASILIAIIGIIFTISLSMLSILREIKPTTPSYILLIVFTSFYFISFCLEMTWLILVIYPRQKRDKENQSLSYYKDVSSMAENEIINCLKSSDYSSEIDQLKINANICAKKHKFLVMAIWTLIPLFTFMVAMFFTSVL